MSKTLLLFLSVRGVLSTLTTSTRPISGRSLRVLGSVNLTRNFHFGQAVMSSGGCSSDKPTSDAYKELTNEEWAKRLEPEQYFVTRERGTEAPFSGKYYNHKGEGVYTCICCGSDLFSSKTKYDSGSGWPSFYDALQNAEADGSATGILRRKDVSHGMVRDEILCKNCNAHLGHVFDDGPQPTGTRYCVNSCALKFQPRKL